jgi:hypothetical protein
VNNDEVPPPTPSEEIVASEDVFQPQSSQEIGFAKTPSPIDDEEDEEEVFYEGPEDAAVTTGTEVQAHVEGPIAKEETTLNLKVISARV